MVGEIGALLIAKTLKLFPKVGISQGIHVHIEQLVRVTGKNLSLRYTNRNEIFTAEISDPLGYRILGNLVEDLLNRRTGWAG